jgi:hypothetical protein
MITEDYVSFEIAKLLKEKGFDDDVLAVYIYDNLFVKGENKIVNTANVPIIPAPTLQMAMKWLREVHNIFIAIDVVPHVTVTMEQKYYFFKLYKDRRPCKSPLNDSVRLYYSYEEACEAAMKYCLEHLI